MRHNLQKFVLFLFVCRWHKRDHHSILELSIFARIWNRNNSNSNSQYFLHVLFLISIKYLIILFYRCGIYPFLFLSFFRLCSRRKIFKILPNNKQKKNRKNIHWNLALFIYYLFQIFDERSSSRRRATEKANGDESRLLAASDDESVTPSSIAMSANVDARGSVWATRSALSNARLNCASVRTTCSSALRVPAIDDADRPVIIIDDDTDAADDDDDDDDTAAVAAMTLSSTCRHNTSNDVSITSRKTLK